MQQTDYERRGYLHEDFHLFHLSSALAEDTAFHYHEFHKLVFFLAGRGNYIVEGRTQKNSVKKVPSLQNVLHS